MDNGITFAIEEGRDRAGDGIGYNEIPMSSEV